MTTDPTLTALTDAIAKTMRAFRGDSAATLIGTYLDECLADADTDDYRESLESILDDLDETIDLYRRETGLDTHTRR
jgi:hypothetical protein